MIAGYALNQRRPLRYEAWVPEEVRFKVPVLMSEPQLCELTCMWISDKPGRLTSERIYLRAILDSLATRAPFVVAGTLVPKIFGIQIQILSQVLYIGETTVFGRPQPCWIYGASRSALAKSLMTLVPIDFARKLLGKPSYLARAKVLAEVAELEARRAGGDRPTDGRTS